MHRTTTFGGPCEIPNCTSCPQHNSPAHPQLVSRNTSTHAANNASTTSFAGLGSGVTYAQPMPHTSMRGLARTGMRHMEEQYPDGCHGSTKRRERPPGAMTMLHGPGGDSVAREDGTRDARSGYQAYLHSSVKGRGEGETRLEPRLDEALRDEGGRHEHKNRHRCGELGTLSERGYHVASSVQPRDSPGSAGNEVFTAGSGPDYNYKAPCGDSRRDGCNWVLPRTNSRDIGDHNH